MKAFVYSKKTNKTVAIVKNVVTVQESSVARQITFVTSSGEVFTFNTVEVKTTTYQN